MLKAYFKIAYRHLVKSKVFSIIHVLGLSVGLLAFLLIIQFASFELSYEQFHINKDEIYRIAFMQVGNGEVKTTSAMNHGGIRNLLRENFPEVQHTTGFSPMPNNLGFLIKYNNKMFLEPGKFLRADTSFFKVFPSLLLKGDERTVLKDPHNIVISQAVAKRVFGNEDPLGQRVSSEYVVAGILADMPKNSHFHADFVVGANMEWDGVDGQWGPPDFYTYASLVPGTNVKILETKLNDLLMGVSEQHPDIKGSTSFIQPIASIHLQSHLQNELEGNASGTLVYVLLLIGVIILVIAWINYVNMETARFISRVREVGIRRIVGSRKRDLAFQFLIEFLCLNGAASLFVWILLSVILPYFSELTGIPINEMQFAVPQLWIGAACLFIVGSLLVGIYPLWFLLKINPAEIIKGVKGGRRRGGRLRPSLVVVQFASSLSLMGFLLVIHHQVEYMRLSNKKIDLERVISIRNPVAYGEDHTFDGEYRDFKALETRLLQDPEIKMVSGSSAIPGTEIGFTFINLLKRTLNDPYSAVRYKMLFIDFNYIPLYDLKLKAGRNFDVENGEDTEIWNKLTRQEKVPSDYYQTLLLNESAIHALGFQSSEEAVNQIIYLHLWADDFEKYKIIGVVEDYNHQSLKKEISPTIFTLNQNKFQEVYFSVKLHAGADPQQSLAYINKSWKEFFPDRPFDYFFVDEYYDQQFKSERHFERIFALFAGVAIFLACLGIIGISLFEANVRLKEISIRKVLGASVSNLVLLLSRDNIRIIMWSCLLAMPVIYYASRQWLSTYPVRIGISFIYFISPLLVLMVVVFLTSIMQTLRAALANPVDHLKHE